MFKLGITHTLGVTLGFAAFHASDRQEYTAIREISDASAFLRLLTEGGVPLDPQGTIATQLGNLFEIGPVNTGLPKSIESIRDVELVNAYGNLNNLTLLHAYLLGVSIGGAEGQATTNNDGARPLIESDAKNAATFATNLTTDTPLPVPLNLSDIPGTLSSIANLSGGEVFEYLHDSLLFVRGKCQGIFDAWPENF